MAIKTRDISEEESIKEQLKDFVNERGTHYADSSRTAVYRFVDHLKDKFVIDLGCGDGAATDYFQEHKVKVQGVDVNRMKSSLNPAFVHDLSMTEYLRSRPDDSIPNIFSHHSLEHTINPQQILDLIARKLEKGGFVYIEVPANDHIHSVHHSTFDSPEDLAPEGLTVIETGSNKEEHYIIAKK